MPTPTRKRLARVEIKDADKGQVDLVFATYNVVDKDGDVQVPGTFEDGAKAAVSAYGHTSWEGKLPVGVATIKTTRSEAQAQAQFFMDTQHGADTFSTVKQLHAAGLGDWSYGYDVLKHSFGEFGEQPNVRRVRFLEKQRVNEVSPVLVGAGINTRTLRAKSASTDDPENGGRTMGYHGAIRPHETATTNDPWTPADVTKDLGLNASTDTLRAIHAWQDMTGDPTLKSSYGFLHHHGANGPANIRACLLGVAALNGGPGPVIPDDAKAAVYEHLAGHLRDADAYVPDLYAADADRSTVKANDAALVVLADLQNVLDQYADVGASMARKGRGFRKGHRDVLGMMRDELARLDALLADPADVGNIDPDNEYARFVAASLRL